jgi:hypothetical protein
MSKVVEVQDPWNPTPADIRQWAADPNSLHDQDWDDAITDMGYEELFLDLVEDEQCPHADFFLHCLYFWVYKTVKSGGKTDELEVMLRRGEASKEPALRIWVRRSRALMANPRRAEKRLWWGFGQKRSDAD